MILYTVLESCIILDLSAVSGSSCIGMRLLWSARLPTPPYPHLSPFFLCMLIKHRTSPCASYTVLPTLFSPHCSPHTAFPTLCSPHCAPHTHCAPHIVLPTLCSPHCVSHRVLLTLCSYTVFPTLCSSHCSPQTVLPTLHSHIALLTAPFSFCACAATAPSAAYFQCIPGEVLHHLE